ncbi:hypothetical protein L211DRAFT_691715 [Terfezia boudieri ATCC MYA-4762]|uniref:Uncharacterized protein n=1 Tax=Terfezia boudieri ATCC MYA-4762 TaxID=1051890 RepID=A0A3N4LAD5_9PEZI|nr:hypothetical protein L211DRAFT_691715 [Terfezia boudieri ATCC MYA-4762]
MFPDLTDSSKLDKAGAESSDWTNSKQVHVIEATKCAIANIPQQKVLDTTVSINWCAIGQQGQGRICNLQIPVQEGGSGSSTMDRRGESESRGPQNGL